MKRRSRRARMGRMAGLPLCVLFASACTLGLEPIEEPSTRATDPDGSTPGTLVDASVVDARIDAPIRGDSVADASGDDASFDGGGDGPSSLDAGADSPVALVDADTRSAQKIVCPTVGALFVSVSANVLSPRTPTVNTGGVVRWASLDGRTHHLVGEEQTFDSGFVTASSPACVRFLGPGVYSYRCSLHPLEVGLIHVP